MKLICEMYLSRHLDVRQKVSDITEADGGEETKGEGEVTGTFLSQVLFTQILKSNRKVIIVQIVACPTSFDASL